MARFWIGTSGWNYNHWRQNFYPKGLPSREWLAFYTTQFSTVELNYSFYRQPATRSWDAWRVAAPDGFRFAVKAHRYLTHRTRLNNPAAPLELILQGASRLHNKLGPLLYQLPPYFKRTPENAVRLDAFLEMLPPELEHVVEFRDKSWYGGETLEQLRGHGVAFCCFDRQNEEPPLAATAPFAYMRFHGSGARYHGNYTNRMLRDWAERLRALAAGLNDVYVYFNNDWQGFAPANARKLVELLGAGVPEAALA